MTRPGPHRGVAAALAAAVLFGLGTPLAKPLLGPAGVSPWLLAGLLYTAAGVALATYRVVTRRTTVRLARGDTAPLVGAVLLGGVAGPVLLMLGLARLPAADAALLLNTEVVLTAVLAWTVFREHTSRRVVVGMVAIAAGAVALTWPAGAGSPAALPGLAVVGACACWAVDNNLTRIVSTREGTWLAALKGLVAGPVNLALATLVGAPWPAPSAVLAGVAVGVVSYGVSLALFITALRELGTARAGAYFALAPFAGALVAVAAFGEPVTPPLIAAGVLMGLGLWLHLGEQHAHRHTHPPLAHAHPHGHDAHHQHLHPPGTATAAMHDHWHEHEPVAHRHEHYPDLHHRHRHDS